jgi:hypothetical protein
MNTMIWLAAKYAIVTSSALSTCVKALLKLSTKGMRPPLRAA